MTGVKKFKIVILSDSTSWLNATIEILALDWNEFGHEVVWLHDLQGVPTADFCFCLSFGQLVPALIRQQFKHALVVHESDLPTGKGWSPLTWQILEGNNYIPITLFEATDEVDSGPIYAQRWVEFEGHELIDELRQAQAETTKEICQWFVDQYPESLSGARVQEGPESFYPRRSPDDSKLDLNKTIAEQFNLFRVADNERYPVFFDFNGRRFYLKISKDGLQQ